MKKLFKNGDSKFVADALVPAYLEYGWEEEQTAPPQNDSPEDQTSSEGADDHTPEDDEEEADGEEVFTCAVCGKTYKTEAGLNRHMAKEHPEA